MKNVLPYMVNLLCTCLLLVLLALTSCRKFVDIDPPVSQVVSATVFTDDRTATSAVMGLYSEMMRINNSVFSAGLTTYISLASDELSYTATAAAQLEFAQNGLAANNSAVLGSFWRPAYTYLYGANAVIEGLEKSSGLTPALRTTLEGEARFLRAFILFHLANLFGDIPLALTTDYSLNTALPRAPVADVYDRVVADLIAARTALPVAYMGTGRTRPNRAAASALLARVYLYRGNWAGAEAMATEVIGTPGYSLPANPADVFLVGSTETVWALQPANPNFNTYEGQNFIPASATARPSYVATPSLLGAFEAGDLRRTAWLRTNTVGGIPYAYPYKYKVRQSATVTEHYTVLRLAEQYLVRAEARARQSNSSGAAADLNMVRARAGLLPTTAATKEALLAAVEKERFTELFAEWGHRWFDLRRTNRIDAVLSPLKSGWQPSDVLLPIPFAELELNRNLTQNPGY